jgi:hypothetical protein
MVAGALEVGERLCGRLNRLLDVYLIISQADEGRPNST